MSAAGTVAPETRPLVPSGLLGTAIFVGTEVMFFAGLVSAFVVLRVQVTDWPPFDQPRLPVAVTGVNTAILLLSGFTMLGVLGALRETRERLVRRLGLTAALGTLFLWIQGYEWIRLIGYGLTTSSSLYGATFYTVVGAHAVRVLAALVVLLVVTWRAGRGRYDEDDTGLRMCRMYWVFVVAIWPVLYGTVYFA